MDNKMNNNSNLLPEITVPYTKLYSFYRTEQEPSNGFPIEKERLGLKRKTKTFTHEEWREVYKELDELADEDSKVENFKVFGSIHFWMDAGFSMPKILRMIASLDDEFTVTERQRRALNLIFQTVIHEGAVTREYSGNTLINRFYLIKFVTDQEYNKQGDWRKKAVAFRYSVEVDKESNRELMDFKESEVNEIIDYAIEQNILGSTIYEGAEHIYYKKHQELETQLLDILTEPVEYSNICDAPEELTAKQKLMFNTVLNSKTRGVINLGEPGTGKSYTANKYIEATGATNWLVLATTGTAAQVLQSSVPEGVSCSTISWAAFNKDKLARKRYLLVDECSMLNITFLQQLKRLIDVFNFEKIVLLGDPNQLPPVGVGAFFASFDDYNTYGVELVTFTEQKRMSQKAMRNLRGLTVQSPVNHTTLFGFGYVKIPFTTEESEGQKCTVSSVINTVKSLDNRIKKGSFSVEAMQDKTTRCVVSTFMNRWANFYSAMVEGMRRGLSEPSGMVNVLEEIIAYYAKNPMPTNEIEKNWKRSLTHIQWELCNVLWGKVKPSKQFNDKYEAVSDKIEVLKELRSQLNNKLLVDFASEGGWYRSNRNIWTTKITGQKLAKLKKKYKIEEIKGDVANGTKFICKCDEEGLYFEACDTNAMIRFAPDSKISNVLSLSWVQTTHKLQGDQGVESIYIHDKEAPMSLVYVALSRGREKNILIAPCPLWNGEFALCHRNFPRLSTLRIENNVY